MNTAAPILELQDVRAGYGPIEVVHGVTLSVPTGAVVALLGPNGGGKTTMLNVCAGTLAPSAGEVRFDGDVVTTLSADGRARRGICTVPEGRGIFPEPHRPGESPDGHAGRGADGTHRGRGPRPNSPG